MSETGRSSRQSEAEAVKVSGLRTVQNAQREREREEEKRGGAPGKYPAEAQKLDGAKKESRKLEPWQRALARLESLVEVAEATAGLARAALGHLTMLKSNDSQAVVESIRHSVNALRKNARAMLVITHDDVGSVGLSDKCKAKKGDEIETVLNAVALRLERIAADYPPGEE